MIEALFGDVALAARRMTRSKGISLTIVLSVAIAVSANVTLLSWISAIVSNPLPAVPQSHQVVAFASKTEASELTPVSYEDYKSYRDELSSLQDLAAFQGRELSVEAGDRVLQAWGMFVTENYFDALRLAPVTGTFFGAEHGLDTPNGQAVAVVSHDFWERRLGRDASIAGATIVLNKQPYTIVGVAPPGFNGTISGLSYDVYVPLLQQDRLTGGDGAWVTNRRFRSLLAFGRLADGKTLSEARAEADLVAARLAESYPDGNTGMRAAVLPFSEAPYGAQTLLSGTLKLLLLASFAVIVVVGANVANLLLLSFSQRDKEMGVRVALGAEPKRITLLCLAEALLLGLVAAALALALSSQSLDLILLFVPALQLPVSLEPRLSGQLILYCIGMVLLVVLAAGAAPAVRAVGVKLGAVLRDGSRSVGAGRWLQRFRHGLVAVQVALAFVTLVAAVLLVMTFARLSKVDPGFDAERIMLVSLRPADPSMELAELDLIADRARKALTASGITGDVAYADYVPLGLAGASWEDLRIEGYAPQPDESMKIFRSLVSDGYFDAMGIPVVEGRSFTERDTRASDKVAVVNETFAKRYFPDRSAIGRRVVGWGQVLTVVGVVADSKYQSLTEGPRPYFYVPYGQFSTQSTDLVMHVATTSGSVSDRFEETVRRTLADVGAAAYISWSMPLRRYIGSSVLGSRLAMSLLAGLAAATLVLASIGMYGVLSQFVVQRTAEIGIRMSLGATKGSIVRFILLQGVRPVLVGIGIGSLIALGVSRVLSAFLYGVAAIDIGVYAGVGLALLAVAAIVCIGPAYRAGSLGPSLAARTT